MSIFNVSGIFRSVGHWLLGIVLTLGVAISACSKDDLVAGGRSAIDHSSTNLPQDAIPALTYIDAGFFIRGSNAEEREYGYTLDEDAYKHQLTRTRKWYEGEPERQRVASDAYSIAITPVTNLQYKYFLEDTGHPQPSVDEETWAGYRLVHPFERTRGFVWQNSSPPEGKNQHPVVLVSYNDATAYAAWLSEKTGQQWRLPTYNQWERAARGDNGAVFPWGDRFDPALLNSHDAGPFTTQAVGQYPAGASPHGMLDAAGQVFEWIAAEPEQSRTWVKGGSWDDKGCGVCRPAARHTRAKTLKHILVGFRVVRIEEE